MLPTTAAARSRSELFDDAARTALGDGRLELVRESELWARLGLVDSGQGIERLYTPAMLAELVRVPDRRDSPLASARRAACEARGAAVAVLRFRGSSRVARKLAQLLAAGCSLSTVNRRLDEAGSLACRRCRGRWRIRRSWSKAAALFVRRGDSLAEPSGQLLIDFDAAGADDGGDAVRSAPVAIPFAAADALAKSDCSRGSAADIPFVAEDLRSLAAELEGKWP